MWKGEPLLFSFWTHSQILWFQHFRQIGMGSQQCFLSSPPQPSPIHPESCALPPLCQHWDVRLLAEIAKCGHVISSLSTNACSQPYSRASFLPWGRPLTPLGPGTALPPAFGLGPLNLGTIQPWGIRDVDLKEWKFLDSLLDWGKCKPLGTNPTRATFPRGIKRKGPLLFLR